MIPRPIVVLALATGLACADAAPPIERHVDAPISCPPPAGTHPDDARRHALCLYHARLAQRQLAELAGIVHRRNAAYHAARAALARASTQLGAILEIGTTITADHLPGSGTSALDALLYGTRSLAWKDCSRYQTRVGKHKNETLRTAAAARRLVRTQLDAAISSDERLTRLLAPRRDLAPSTPPALTALLEPLPHRTLWASTAAHVAARTATINAPHVGPDIAPHLTRRALTHAAAYDDDGGLGPWDGTWGKQWCQSGDRTLPARPRRQLGTTPQGVYDSKREAILAARWMLDEIRARHPGLPDRIVCAFHGVQSSPPEQEHGPCNWTAPLAMHPARWLERYKRERALACEATDPNDEERTRVRPWRHPRCSQLDTWRRHRQQAGNDPHWTIEHQGNQKYEARIAAIRASTPSADTLTTAIQPLLRSDSAAQRCLATVIAHCDGAAGRLPLAPPPLTATPWTSCEPPAVRARCVRDALSSPACTPFAERSRSAPNGCPRSVWTKATTAENAEHRATDALERNQHIRIDVETDHQTSPTQRARSDYECSSVLLSQCPGIDTNTTAAPWEACPSTRSPCVDDVLTTHTGCAAQNRAWRALEECLDQLDDPIAEHEST